METNNLADITQRGAANQLELTQLGNATFTIEQLGNGAALSITQY